MTPQRGAVHVLDLRSAEGAPVPTRATHVVILSEDGWNRAMRTVVAVPVVPGAPAVDVFHTAVADLGHADASIVQSIGVDALGPCVTVLGGDVLDNVARSVVAYLDLAALEARRVRRPPSLPAGHAAQKAIHWADLGLDERKRVLVVSPDERNAVAPYVTALYVTSRDKARRRAWQVPAAGGWVITGDLLVQTHRSLEHRRRPTPRRATAAEMTEVAGAVRGVLGG